MTIQVIPLPIIVHGTVKHKEILMECDDTFLKQNHLFTDNKFAFIIISFKTKILFTFKHIVMLSW